MPRHPCCQQRCGYVRCEHGYHRWRQVHHRADDHRPHRSPDLALPSQHADLRVLPPRVGRPADDHVLGRYPAPGRDYPGTVNGTIVKAIETAKELGYVEAGDLTVATAGDPRMSVQLEDKVSSTNVAYVAQVR